MRQKNVVHLKLLFVLPTHIIRKKFGNGLGFLFNLLVSM